MLIYQINSKTQQGHKLVANCLNDLPYSIGEIEIEEIKKTLEEGKLYNLKIDTGFNKLINIIIIPSNL